MRLTSFLAFGILLLPSFARADKTRPANLELGPDIGLVYLVPDAGVRTLPAVGYGAHLSIPIARWMTVSAYYRRSDPVLRVEGASLGLSVPPIVQGTVGNYALGARAEPTWTIDARSRVWLLVGAEWGAVDFPSLRVEGPDPYTLATPHQTFVHFPLGFGGHVEVVRNWLGVQGSVSAGPVVGETGSVGVQSISRSGAAVSGRGLPSLRSVFTAMASIVVEL